MHSTFIRIFQVFWCLVPINPVNTAIWYAKCRAYLTYIQIPKILSENSIFLTEWKIFLQEKKTSEIYYIYKSLFPLCVTIKKDEERIYMDIHFPMNFQCEFSWDTLLSTDDSGGYHCAKWATYHTYFPYHCTGRIVTENQVNVLSVHVRCILINIRYQHHNFPFIFVWKILLFIYLETRYVIISANEVEVFWFLHSRNS